MTGGHSDEGSGLIPFVQPVGLGRRLTATLEQAHAAAVAAPGDAGKVGHLGMLYLYVASPVEASVCLERALLLEPKSARWLYYLARAYQDQYNTDKAAAVLRQAIAADERYAATRLMLGDLLFERDLDACRALYEQAASLNPSDARVHFGLGRCELKRGDGDRAIQHFRRAIELSPTYAAAHAAVADLLTAAGNGDAAKEHRRRAQRGGDPPIVGDPLNNELMLCGETNTALITEAEEIARGGDPQRAVELLRAAVDKGEADAAVRNALGILLCEQNRPEEGLRQFRTALEAEPHRAEIRSNVAYALQRLGRSRQAEEIFLSLLEDWPGDRKTLQLYARMLVELGRPREALPRLATLIESAPTLAEPYLDAAVAAVCAGDTDAALTAYDAYLKRADRAADRGGRLSTSLVKMLSQQQMFPPESALRPALLDLDRLQGLVPLLRARGWAREAELAAGAADLMIAEALSTAERGRFEHAMRILNTGADGDRSGAIENAVGVILMLQHQFDEAEPHLRRAISQDGDLVIAKSNLGECLIRKNRNADAERLFREALIKDPRHAVTLRRLGVLLGKTGRAGEGLEMIRACEAVEPGEPANQYCKADILAEQGRRDEALELLRRTSRPRRSDAETHQALGSLLHRLGSDVDAEREWRTAIRLRPGFVGAYLAMEAAALKRKDYPGAKSILSEGLHQTQESALLRNNLAYILATCPDARERDPEEAVRMARSACEMTNHSNHQLLDTLAICLAAVGKFEEAARMERRAIALAEEAVEADRAKEFRGRLALFESGKAFYMEK